MSLRFVDGFDSYVTADLSKKWTSVGASPTISAGNGRRSTASLRHASVTTYLGRTLDSQPTWIIGMATRVTARASTQPNTIIGLEDSGVSQLDLRLNPTGTLSVYRTSTALGTSTYVLPLNTYVYLEWLVTIHNTTGLTTVRADGAPILTLTNVDTQNSANATANAIFIGHLGVQSMGTQDIDDVYICDGTGAAPHNTFLGDCRVDTLLPSSDGTSQQWAPSTPGTHYTLVDDAAPNTTDYVASGTVGQRDTYGIQDLTAQTGIIYAVQLSLAALKTDAGIRSIKPLILSGASEALGAAAALNTSQTYVRHVQTTDPATGAAWAESAVNAMQCGIETA